MEKPGRKDLKKFMPVPEKDITMAIAWMKDEIMLSKQMKFFGKGRWGSALYSRLARALREAYRRKMLVINK